jgi:hypothetical protein
VKDDQIIEYLRARSRAEPPIDLVESVVDAIAEVPQRRAAWFGPLLPAAAAIAAAAAVTVAVLILTSVPQVGPTPEPSPSASVQEEPGEVLLEEGDVVVMPAVDADGVYGTITIERGRTRESYEGWETGNPWEAHFVELHVAYAFDRPSVSTYGELSFGITGDATVNGQDLSDTIYFGTVRPLGGPEPLLGNMMSGDEPIAGWIVIQIPMDYENANVDLVHSLGGQQLGPIDWRVPLQLADANSPTPPPLPTPEPVSYVEKLGLPFTVIESAEADSLFATIDTCTNPDGYTVSFPDDWYTNTAVGTVPACSWFSPVFFEVDDPQRIPDEVAIELAIRETGLGQIPEYPRTLQEDVVISGVDGFRTEDTIPSNPPDFAYGYAAWLDDDALGRKAMGSTSTMRGGDYELNKAVLDRIMAGMLLTDPNDLPDTFTPEPNPDADGLFLNRSECTNRQDGYAIDYPFTWFTNEAGDPGAADPDAECTDFLPEPIEEGVISAIRGERITGRPATFDEEIDRQLHTIAGRPAIRAEYRAALGNPPPDRRWLVWRVLLGSDEDRGPYLVFTTSTDDARDYELNKAVLDRMMLSLRVSE